MLEAFWKRYHDAKGPLEAWHTEAETSTWTTPQDIKNRYAKASFVLGRVVFDIRGNHYRLIVRVRYGVNGSVLILWVGTHSEYDRLDISSL